MSTNTTNYNLVKPADNETADILVINANMDTVDAQLKTNADAITTKETPTGAQTKATTAENNAKTYADSKETPSGAQAKADAVQSNLTSHLADMLTQLGLKADKVTLDLVKNGILLQSDIKGTTQTPTYTGADITRITHKDASLNVIRTDNITYTPTLITEVRTLADSTTVTFKYYFNGDGSYNRTEVS